MKLSVGVLLCKIFATQYLQIEPDLAKEVTLSGRFCDDEGGEDTGDQDDAV